MTVREYVGARYVPLYIGAWDNTKAYEPLSIVTYQGDSYTSRQAVPTGIDITNETYWVLSAAYNAQVEQYRQEVLAFDGRIDALEDALPIADFDDTNTIDARFDTIEADDWVSTNRIADNAVTTPKIVDDAVTTPKIVDDAVTTPKIVDGAITYSKLATGLVRDHMVVCGDSWTDVNIALSPRWDVQVAQQLDLTLYDQSALGATGYTTSPNSFITQLEASAAAIDPRRVKYVMILGGINDINSYNESTFRTAVENTIAKAQTLFPYSEIVIIGPQGNYRFPSNNFWSMITIMSESCYAAGVCYVPIPFMLVGGYDLVVPQDHTPASSHPSAKGQSHIAAFVMSCMNGRKFCKRSVSLTTDLDLTINDDDWNASKNMFLLDSSYNKIGSNNGYSYSDCYASIAPDEMLLDATLEILTGHTTDVYVRFPFNASVKTFPTHNRLVYQTDIIKVDSSQDWTLGWWWTLGANLQGMGLHAGRSAVTVSGERCNVHIMKKFSAYD